MHTAITDLVITRRPAPQFASAIDRFDFFHVTPGLAAESARVHGQRSTDSAGNTRKEFGGAQSPLHALLRKPCAMHPCFGIHMRIIDSA